MQVTGDEAVLLDLASEQYFGLNAVGVRVWQLLAENPSMESVFRVVSAEYDVAPAQLERDVLALLKQLSDAGLVSLT